MTDRSGRSVLTGCGAGPATLAVHVVDEWEVFETGTRLEEADATDVPVVGIGRPIE